MMWLSGLNYFEQLRNELLNRPIYELNLPMSQYSEKFIFARKYVDSNLY